jgi:hypothetical protein
VVDQNISGKTFPFATDLARAVDGLHLSEKTSLYWRVKAEDPVLRPQATYSAAEKFFYVPEVTPQVVTEAIALSTPPEKRVATEQQKNPSRKIASTESASPPTPLAAASAPEPEQISDPYDPSSSRYSIAAGYGATHLDFRQTGTLGTAQGSILAFNTFLLKAGLRAGDISGHIDLGRYSAAVGAGTPGNPAPAQDFISFAIRAGFKGFRIGVASESSPILRGTAAVDWDHLTTISALLGYSHRIEWLDRKRRLQRFDFEVEGSVPLSGSGRAGGLNPDSISGFGASLHFGAKKEIFSFGETKTLVGMDLGAKISSTSARGIWGTDSGDLKRTVGQYQGILRISFEW